ncbi:hypothetical protein DITRI_Ditri16bG0035800 [Diplodiscus trichospermus]
MEGQGQGSGSNSNSFPRNTFSNDGLGSDHLNVILNAFANAGYNTIVQGESQGQDRNPRNIYFNDGLPSGQHNVVPNALADDGHAIMQGEGNSSNSFPRNIFFNDGFPFAQLNPIFDALANIRSIMRGEGQDRGNSSHSFLRNMFFNDGFLSDQRVVVPDALSNDEHTIMQGEGNSSPRNIFFNDGLPFDQHNLFLDALANYGRTIMQGEGNSSNSFPGTNFSNGGLPFDQRSAVRDALANYARTTMHGEGNSSNSFPANIFSNGSLPILDQRIAILDALANYARAMMHGEGNSSNSYPGNIVSNGGLAIDQRNAILDALANYGRTTMHGEGQGQGSTSNSLPRNIFFNDGLPSDQHNVVPDALANGGHTNTIMQDEGQGQGSSFNSYLENIFLNIGGLSSNQGNLVPDAFAYNERTITQGEAQGNSSNSFSRSIHFNGLEPDQQNVVLNGDASMRGIGQSNSIFDTQNQARLRHFLSDYLRLSALGNQARTNQRLEERHSNEPTFNPFLQNVMSPSTVNPSLENIGMNSENGHISNEHGPIDPSSSLTGQGSSSGPRQQNLDLNAVVHDGNGSGARQRNGPYLSLDLFRAGTSSGDHHIPTSNGRSSSPVTIYSGTAGYVLEENISSEGLQTDGRRRLLCKRRAPEASSGASSSHTLQAGNSEQSGVAAQDNVISSLNASGSLNNRLNSSHSTGIVLGLPAPSAAHRVQSEAGQLDNFRRNTRLRRTESRQNPTPPNLLTRNSGSAPAPVPVDTLMQSNVQLSNSLQTPQPFQHLNGTTMSVGSSSTAPDRVVNFREALIHEGNLRNNRRNMRIPSANMQANLNMANGNANFNGNIASSSRVQSLSGISPLASSTRSHEAVAAEYVQRVRDIARQAAEFNRAAEAEVRRQGNYCPIHSPSPAMRDMDISVRGGNPRAAQVPLMLGQRAERQAGHRSEPTLPTRTALRRPGQASEDFMILGSQYLYAIPEGPDVHEDMRLDIDNMSYEELLNLEERIGNVNTGLSEEFIVANLRRRIYHQPISLGAPVPEEAAPCCICQEDYAEGEEIAKLGCGHDFHFGCIKQWLEQKNSCPICKRKALAV